jgi:hypothetical protein
MRINRWNLDVTAAILALLCSAGYAADDSDIKPLSNEEAEAILTPPIHKNETPEPEDCQALKSSLPGSKEYEIHEVGCSVFRALNTELDRCTFRPMPSGSFVISLVISVRGQATVEVRNVDLKDLRIAECYADIIRTIHWKPRSKPFGPHETAFQFNGWPNN